MKKMMMMPKMHRLKSPNLTTWLISAAFAALFAISSAHASSFDQELKKADAIRTSDIKKFGQKLEELSLHENQFNAEEKAYYQYLNYYLKGVQGDFTSAIAGYESLVTPTSPQNIKLRARISLVNIFTFTQEWQKGISQLTLLVSQLNTIKDQSIKEKIEMVAAVFYNGLGQYQLGLQYSQQLKITSTSLRGKCAAAHFEVEAAFGLNRLTSSSDLFAEAIEKCQQANEAVIIGLINNFKIRSLIKEQNYQAAMSLLNQQLPQIENTSYTPLKGVYYSLIAEAAVKLEQWDVVKKYGELAAPLLAQGQSYQSAMRTYKALYEYYVHVNGTTDALEAYKKYAEADKIYVDDIQAKSLAFQLAQHQSIEQQNRIELLDKQNKLLQLQQQLSKKESNSRRDMLIALFCICAMLVVVIVQNRRTQKHLRNLAELDGLTNVLNRRHYTQIAEKALRFAKSEQQSVSCVMFDLDYFKQLNDSLGHGAGDVALVHVATIAKLLCRPSDIIGRIGGEEFCILLPNTSKQEAYEIAERLRQCFTEVRDIALGDDHTITASFGVAVTDTSGYRLEALMHDADQAMYHAKEKGRNRVVLFFEELKSLSIQPQIG